MWQKAEMEVITDKEANADKGRKSRTLHCPHGDAAMVRGCVALQKAEMEKVNNKKKASADKGSEKKTMKDKVLEKEFKLVSNPSAHTHSDLQLSQRAHPAHTRSDPGLSLRANPAASFHRLPIIVMFRAATRAVKPC